MKNNFVWYVAGPWADRPLVREQIRKINDAGWQTNSRWADESVPDPDPNDPKLEEYMRAQAIRDVEDVINADGLIYINSRMSEGKATELGMSIAMLKPIVIIGKRENNIFLNLRIPAYPTTEEALEWLEGEGQLYLSWVQEQQRNHLSTVAALSEIEESPIDYPSE